MSSPTSLQTEAVRLALAACVGKGAETRDFVELAADVVGEVFRLRGTMAVAAPNDLSEEAPAREGPPAEPNPPRVLRGPVGVSMTAHTTCPNRDCINGKVSSEAWEAPPAPCPDCSGRVANAEATLRAEVAKLRGKMADAEANARQAAELAERRLSLMNQLGRTLNVSVRREDALRAEVERLTAEFERLKRTVVWQRGRIPTPDLGPYDDRDDAAERERYLVVFSDGCLDIGPLADFRAERQLPDVVAWARVGMPDAAWLAGCKP